MTPIDNDDDHCDHHDHHDYDDEDDDDHHHHGDHDDDYDNCFIWLTMVSCAPLYVAPFTLRGVIIDHSPQSKV